MPGTGEPAAFLALLGERDAAAAVAAAGLAQRVRLEALREALDRSAAQHATDAARIRELELQVHDLQALAREVEQRLAQAEGVAAARAAELADIHASRLWRVATAYRSVRRLSRHRR